MVRRLIPIVAAALLSAALAGCNRKDPPPPPPPPPPLTPQGLAYSSWKSATPDLHDRLLLAHALALGKTEAIAMVATRIGGTPAVATQIARFGGEIQERFDDVGYLYARLPIERLSDVSAMPDVLMAHLDGGAPGGSYALDRDFTNYSVGLMWANRVGRRNRVDGYTSPTETLLGIPRQPLSQTPLAISREARESTPSDVPLAIGIHHLLMRGSSSDVNVGLLSQGEDRFPAGGQDLYSLMANRAVEVYRKPMFAAAGHGARIDSINGAASGRRVLAIAALEADDRVAAWSGKGPAADGGAKPDLLAPSAQQIDSMSAEIAATARAELLPDDARHVSWALRMSARRLDNYQVHEQGFGVIDVPRAYELLRQVKSRKFELPDILTRAPVKTYLSRFLPEPGVGQGLYEREGWLARQPGTRKITLLRQNGPSTPLTYQLQWQGGDGSTFKVKQDEVTLPFDTAVELEVEIAPAEVGVHSALLYLIDKTTQLPVHAVMTTIVASEQFTAANGYTIQHDKQALTEQRARRYFLEVPPNVSSLRVNVAATAGQVEMLLGTGGALGAGVNLPRGQPIGPGKPALAVVPYPPAGVYELTLLPSSNAQVDLSASIHYVDSQLDEAPPKNNSTQLWMNNIYAPLQRAAVLTEVGARRTLDDVGGATGMRSYNINVPAESTSLRVAASPPDGRARLGLYLYDCVDGSCELWSSDAFTRTTEKILIVPKPRAGLWRVVVDASAPGTAFRYSEVITNPRFGSGTAGGQDEPRRTGARWNQAVSFQIGEPVPFGYDAVAVMDVIDSAAGEAERGASYMDAREQPPSPLRLTTQVFKLSRN